MYINTWHKKKENLFISIDTHTHKQQGKLSAAATTARARKREKRICKSVPLFSKWETNAKMAIECEAGREA